MDALNGVWFEALLALRSRKRNGRRPSWFYPSESFGHWLHTILALTYMRTVYFSLWQSRWSYPVPETSRMDLLAPEQDFRGSCSPLLANRCCSPHIPAPHKQWREDGDRPRTPAPFRNREVLIRMGACVHPAVVPPDIAENPSRTKTASDHSG